MRELWTLREFVWRYRWRYLFGIFSIIITDLCQLSIPRILGYFTDDIKDGNIAGSKLWTYIALLLLVSVGIFVFRYLWRVMIFGAARTLEYELRNRLFAHYQKLPPSWYNNRKTGDLMALATNDLQAVRFTFGGGVVISFDVVVLLSIAIFMMAGTIDWRLTLVGLIPLPVMGFIAIRFGGMIHERFRDAQEAFSSLTDRVQENLSGMRVVKAFAQEDEEVKKFSGVNELNFEKNLRLAKISAIFDPMVQWITGVSMLLVLAYGGILVIQNEITLGDFVAFNAYLGLLTGPILGIGWLINIFQRGSASMGRINEIMYTKPEIRDEIEKIKPVDALHGSISIDDLTFRYPGAKVPALEHISVDLPAGQTLAIIGSTGSGKTTLVNLLLRLYNVLPGKIRLDGIDIHEIPLHVLRRDIGYVPQDNFLFSETIRENIAFGAERYTEEQVTEAAEDAQLLDNILEFPMQMDTMLGERGVTLSGGQKQRLSIARALLKNPKILILDDSLSAVDTKTEEAILERLKQKRTGKTTIIVAHRVSTVKHADEIIVIEDGSIVERGKHEQLLSRQGNYARLYEKQLLEDEVASEM